MTLSVLECAFCFLCTSVWGTWEYFIHGCSNCTCKLIFIIKFILIPDINHSLSSAQTYALCPKEWILYSHNCYYIGMERKSWNDSLVSCISKNCSLLYIDSEEEQVRADMCQSLLTLSSCQHLYNQLIFLCMFHLQHYIIFHCFILQCFTCICVLVINIYLQLVYFILFYFMKAILVHVF